MKIQADNGKLREVRCRVVVDASGQNGLIMNRLNLRIWDPILNKGAIWTYWEGAYRDSGRDEGATMVLQTTSKNGWFWYIPLHNNIVSVGVVAPFDYLFKGRDGFEQTYNEEVDRCPAVKQRVSSGKRVTGYFATKIIPTGRRKLPAMAGFSLVMPLVSSIRSIPRAFCSLSNRGSLQLMPSSKASRKATRRPRNSASGARASTKVSTACGD